MTSELAQELFALQPNLDSTIVMNTAVAAPQ
jgi:hypothetical protein